MNAVRRVIATTAVTCFTVGCCMFAELQLATWANPRPNAVPPQVSPLTLEQRASDPTPPFRGASVRHDGPAVDIYGNEVTEAVAKYKLDATGLLYEEHSPSTEIPRLGVPTT